MAKSNIKRPRITKDIEDAVLELHLKGLSPSLIKATLGRESPSLRSIQMIIAKAIKIENTPKFQKLGQPWHLGLMTDPEYTVDPKAVPYILATQVWSEKHEHESVTIRQALWIGRLYACTGLTDSKDWLWHWSRAYAIEEITSNLLDSECNTSLLDKGLREESSIEVFPDWAYAIFTRDGVLIDGPKTVIKEGEQ